MSNLRKTILFVLLLSLFASQTSSGTTTTTSGTTTSGATTTTSGSTTTTTSATTTPETTTVGGEYYELTVRARGTHGSEQINLSVGGDQIGGYILGTDYDICMINCHAASTADTGDIVVCFINDQSGRDVQIDYVAVDHIVEGVSDVTIRQAEDQSDNTGVWQYGCGGSYSEWLHCNGCINFGDISGSSSTTTTTSGSTTTTSSWWWGSWW